MLIPLGRPTELFIVPVIAAQILRDGAYIGSLAADRKESPIKWCQRVSSLSE